jgi:hypothetical protein
MDRRSSHQSVTQTPSTDQCPGCQQELLGRYCHHCGEQRFDDTQLSFRHIIVQLFTSLTDVDGKLWVSLRLLITRPGQLTLDFLQGRRKQRLTPFQLFVLVNVFFFLAVAWWGSSAYTTSLHFHLNATNFFHQPLAVEWVNQHLLDQQMSYEAYELRFNQVAALQAKSLVFLIIPMFALVVVLLDFRRRHKGIVALVFATHFFTFMLLMQAIIVPMLLWSLMKLNAVLPVFTGESIELVFSLLLFVGFSVYFYLAARRVFAYNHLTTTMQALLMGFSIYFITLIYRMVLFFTTFWMA